MADNFLLATQKAAIAALRANTGVTDLISNRIYDEPPANPTFPYARFGQINSAAFDTDTSEGATVDFSIEVHSQSASGRVEAARIAEAVKAALHRQETSISIDAATGLTLVEMINETMLIYRNNEGRGHTAVVGFQALLDQL